MKSLMLKLIIAVLSNILAPLYSYYSGQNKIKNEYKENELQSIKKANSIRSKLISDNDYSAGVRKKFTR